MLCQSCHAPNPDTNRFCENCGTGLAQACRACGAEARLNVDGQAVTLEASDEKAARTHWDMLLERRSEKELEDILKERLELLRGGEIGPAHLHRASARKKKVG